MRILLLGVLVKSGLHSEDSNACQSLQLLERYFRLVYDFDVTGRDEDIYHYSELLIFARSHFASGNASF
jgi:hypothetical protein